MLMYYNNTINTNEQSDLRIQQHYDIIVEILYNIIQ